MSNRIPSLRHHRYSGRAVVTLNGVDHYLGRFGSRASDEAYHRLIGEWLAHGRRLPGESVPGPTVGELWAAFLRHARPYYARNSKPTSSINKFLYAMADVVERYGSEPASAFGPLKLKAIRDGWTARGDWCRGTINTRCGAIRQVFKWGVGEELISPAVHQALTAVPGLASGRTAAPEHEPVGPVPDEHVAAVLPFLIPAMAALVRVQDLTGMRPGEALRLRPIDINRDVDPWEYIPTDRRRRPDHKTAHLGKSRVVLIGPQAQAILAPWVARADRPEDYLFHAPRGRYAGRRARPHYGRAAYHAAITKACGKASVPHWHPNQLRHSVATRIRAALGRDGLDAAQSILGHSSRRTTEIYAGLDLEKARKAIAKLG